MEKNLKSLRMWWEIMARLAKKIGELDGLSVQKKNGVKKCWL